MHYILFVYIASFVLSGIGNSDANTRPRTSAKRPVPAPPSVPMAIMSRLDEADEEEMREAVFDGEFKSVPFRFEELFICLFGILKLMRVALCIP